MGFTWKPVGFHNHEALRYRCNNVEIFADSFIIHSLNIHYKYHCNHFTIGACPVSLRTHRVIDSYLVKERRI